MEQIVFEIDPEGRVKIDAVGFEGSDCEEATRAVEQALGTPVDREMKPEAFVGEQQTVSAGS